MVGVNKGEVLFIPVEVGDGAFAGERIITFDTLEGPVSGFINDSQVIKRDGADFIEANVLEVAPDRIQVRLHGSFFTTTGLAHISPETAYGRAA